MNKNKVDSIIDKLVDKTLSFGCRVEWKDKTLGTVLDWDGSQGHIQDDDMKYQIEDCHYWIEDGVEKGEIKILGHPILIGDVLKETYKIKDTGKWQRTQSRLLCLWQYCGISKSLQEILESGWEEKKCECHNSGISPCYFCENYGSKNQTRKVLKPEAKELLEFIESSSDIQPHWCIKNGTKDCTCEKCKPELHSVTTPRGK